MHPVKIFWSCYGITSVVMLVAGGFSGIFFVFLGIPWVLVHSWLDEQFGPFIVSDGAELFFGFFVSDRKWNSPDPVVETSNAETSCEMNSHSPGAHGVWNPSMHAVGAAEDLDLFEDGRSQGPFNPEA